MPKESVDIAVLKTKMDMVGESIEEIKRTLETIQNNHLSHIYARLGNLEKAQAKYLAKLGIVFTIVMTAVAAGIQLIFRLIKI